MRKAPFVISMLALAVIMLWFWQPLRSAAVMSYYSALHEKESLYSRKGFDVDIPGGLTTPERDWFSFVMTYNAEDFVARNGDFKGMTVLYNFPAFNPLTGTNSFYESESKFCSAFYGAYLIDCRDNIPFGFDSTGLPVESEITDAFDYDYRKLVLESLGEHDFIFNIIDSHTTSAELHGIPGWIRIDAIIETNSVVHNFTEPKRSYLQYGRPLGDSKSDFPVINMYGRLYIRFFEEYNTTIILYAMTPDKDSLEQCDRNFLIKTVISD